MVQIRGLSVGGLLSLFHEHTRIANLVYWMPELTYLLGAESYSWPGTYRMLQVVCLGLAPWYASTRWSQRHQPWCYRLAFRCLVSRLPSA